MENKPSMLTKRYEIGRLLGKGTFAKVYYARCIETNLSVAIKVIDKEKISKVGTMNQIKREISVMKLARHPNVVQLYEVMATKSKIFFVMEYCKGGELFDKVANGRLKVDVARKYFIQLVTAVDFCHSRGIYHRDIKPENLLLDDNENLKVTDFGLSALADSKRQDGLLHTTCGTPAYVAPEVINRKGYDGVAADIWSCGVVLFVLLSGYLPFHDSNVMEMYRKIGKAEFRYPSWFPMEARRLVSKMLDPNPYSRITMSRIRTSTWYRRELNVEQKKPENMQASLDRGNSNDNAETKQKSDQLRNLNAFDIIATSDGFDLSGLFDGIREKRETRFSSRQPASVIISKLEEAARNLRLKVKKKDAGVLKMENLKEGRKGILSIDAEIFQVTPNLHVVEIKKSNGDTLEYEKILKEDMRPALQDIVWVWQGDQQQQQLLKQQELQHDERPQRRQQNASTSVSCSSRENPSRTGSNYI